MRTLFLAVLALLTFGGTAQAHTSSPYKGYWYGAESPQALASIVEHSLARDPSGKSLLSAQKCRADGSCATAAAYLASFQAHDPEARLTDVSQIPAYMRSLERDCSVSGKFQMDRIVLKKDGSVHADVNGMSRALRPGECAWVNKVTGRVVLAPHCANPVGRALDRVACVYINFQSKPEIAAHYAVKDPEDRCLAWRNASAFAQSDNGKGWNELPGDCGYMICNFEDISQRTGVSFGRIGGIPLTAGWHQLRVSPDNFVVLCLEALTNGVSTSSFSSGVRYPRDYRFVQNEHHARIYYQSSDVPGGITSTDPYLVSWATTVRDETQLRTKAFAAH